MVNEIHRHRRGHGKAALRPAIPAISEVLAVSPATARRLVKAGSIQVLRAGAGLRIAPAELDRIFAMGAPAK